MAYGESNGHVIDDVAWPSKVKLVTKIRLEPNISKTEIDAIQQKNLTPIIRSGDAIFSLSLTQL